MNNKKHILLFMLVITGIFCIACGRNTNNTYITKFSKCIARAYPAFEFDYPDNWTISKECLNKNGEEVVLKNDRGVEITFLHTSGISKESGGGGSGLYLWRTEVSKVADSSFVPGYVEGTDYSNLGAFMVAELKITGEINKEKDVDYTEVKDRTRGIVQYAVLPESWIGTMDYTSGRLDEIAFWYSDYIELVATSPDNKFSEEENQEVIKILSSFRNADSVKNTKSNSK